MTGYKGFDENFCCQGMKFAVGETFRHEGELKLCESGFHFCTEPLAVWQFYPPNKNNRFALVEVTGKIIHADDDSKKACTDEIKIVKELSLDELIQAATNSGNCSAATNSGNCSAATSTGYYSAATNTGDCSAATSTGNFSAATNVGKLSTAIGTGNFSVAINTGNFSTADVSGEKSIAVVTGRGSKARGKIGCWLVLTEWEGKQPADVQVFKVDGENIKPDTFYTLKDGKPVEVQEVTT